jgi:hypothetical protein
LDRASCQQQNTIVSQSGHHWLCNFASEEQETAGCTAPAEATHFHSGDDGGIRKLLAEQFIIHQPEQMPNPDYTVAVAGQSSRY